MEIQKIKELIDVLVANDLSEIELTEGEHRVRLIKRLRTEDRAWVNAVPAASPLAEQSGTAYMVPAEVPLQQTSNAQGDERVMAPLYGVLHLTPAPGAATFVQIGDTVQPGQTLCVIEAMKMFHEVKASCSGHVEAILATAGEEVEAGAALFQLKAVQ